MLEEKMKILVVEDSKFFTTAIRFKLKVFKDIEPFFAATYQEAQDLIEAEGAFFIALLDLCLPDAQKGEIVELTHEHKIPSIILSSSYDRERLNYYYSQGAIDCVSKDNSASLDYLISLLRRLLLNRNIRVMVVEDAVTSRKILAAQLKRQLVTVIQAENGQDAMDKLEDLGSVDLILTDYNMPRMNGFDLTRNVREKHPKSRLPIIGMTGLGREDYALQFLKLGANDFIHKPFSYEELLCRVSQNLDLACLIGELRDSLNTDALTGLYNRRYLFEYGDNIYKKRYKGRDKMTLAMVDIDHFKNINDTYGHQFGDDVLCEVSAILADHMGKDDVVARFGGEEFCIILRNTQGDAAIKLLETIRLSVAGQVLKIDDETVHVSISIGVCGTLRNSFEHSIKTADLALYEAKNKGRNCLRLAQDVAMSRPA